MMTTASIAAVDVLIEEFISYQKHHGPKVDRGSEKLIRRIDRKRLYALSNRAGMGFTRKNISTYLQEYRFAQADHSTRFTLAAQGYGSNARWIIMEGPGLNLHETERLRLAHTQWVMKDLSDRAASDTIRELLPQLAGLPTVKELVEDAAEDLEVVLRRLVKRIVRDQETLAAQVGLDLLEALDADTPAESSLFASLDD